MPKIAKELGALAVSRLSSEGFHAVGGVPGLSLDIDGGSRAWVLRYTAPGTGARRKIGLCPYQDTVAVRKEVATVQSAEEVVATPPTEKKAIAEKITQEESKQEEEGAPHPEEEKIISWGTQESGNKASLFN